MKKASDFIQPQPMYTSETTPIVPLTKREELASRAMSGMLVHTESSKRAIKSTIKLSVFAADELIKALNAETD